VIQLVVWGLFILEEIESDAAFRRLPGGEESDLPPQSSGVAGVMIASVVTMGLVIGAIVSGVRGRRLAEAEGPGRVAATIRLVLGILFWSARSWPY
jgi:hypothetical protein